MVLKIASIHDPEKMSWKVMLILVCADAVDNVNCLQGPVFLGIGIVCLVLLNLQPCVRCSEKQMT